MTTQLWVLAAIAFALCIIYIACEIKRKFEMSTAAFTGMCLVIVLIIMSIP